MTKIIELTKIIGDLSKETYYINVDYIEYFRSTTIADGINCTAVYLRDEESKEIDVSETPEQIRNLINTCSYAAVN